MKSMAQQKAFITGIAGTELTDQEQDFIVEHQPWGFILFGRNVQNEAQLCRLNEALRQACGRDNVAILVDQEGGRVRRLRPPLVPDYPSAATLGFLYRQDEQTGLRATWLMSRLHAFDLRRFGFNVNCLPVLDVPTRGAHDAIGTRAYGDDVLMVSAMGRMAAQGLLAGGILPVMKHIPGQGRALQDTHLSPAHVEVTLETLRKHDFVPFQMLRHLPAAMSSHIVYDSVDKNNPATFSARLVAEIIRTEIGFDGLLMSDDIGMQALSGTFGERARKCFAAGFDLVLHCSGDRQEMQEIASVVHPLTGKSLKRAQSALERIDVTDHADEASLREEFVTLTRMIES